MLWRASDLHGFDIKATDGAIGSVDDFRSSNDDWIARWAVIDTGNWVWPAGPFCRPPDAGRCEFRQHLGRPDPASRWN